MKNFDFYELMQTAPGAGGAPAGAPGAAAPNPATVPGRVPTELPNTVPDQANFLRQHATLLDQIQQALANNQQALAVEKITQLTRLLGFKRTLCACIRHERGRQTGPRRSLVQYGRGWRY